VHNTIFVVMYFLNWWRAQGTIIGMWGLQNFVRAKESSYLKKLGTTGLIEMKLYVSHICGLKWYMWV